MNKIKIYVITFDVPIRHKVIYYTYKSKVDILHGITNFMVKMLIVK
jgi:hypothetical protein